MKDGTQVTEFLATLAADTPTPGGGGAAALAGALAAALTQMVAGLTTGRRRYREIDEEAGQIVQQAQELRTELVQAVKDDAYVYQRVMTVLQHQSTKNDQTVIQALEDALVGAAQVPLNVARRCRDVTVLAETLARHGNVHAVGDAAAAVFLARAAVQASALNIEINLRNVNNEKLKTSWINQSQRLLDEVNERATAVAQIARDRLTAVEQPKRRRRRS